MISCHCVLACYWEDQLRNEGGKYAHLNEDLHVHIETYAEPVEGYNWLLHLRASTSPCSVASQLNLVRVTC